MGLFGRSKKEKADMSDSPDAVESIIKATMVASSEEDHLDEASKVELDRRLKSIVGSGFSEESMRVALMAGHPKIRGRVADFLIKVGQSRGTVKRGSPEGEQMMRDAMESSSPTVLKHGADALIEWAKRR